MRTVLGLLVVIGLAAGGGAFYFKYMSPDQAVNFRTAVVKRGDLQPTISATGTLEPEEVVDVGAQVAGRIVKFGPDQSDPEGKKPVDYRSEVKKDQVLAEIDPLMYKAQRDQAEALLERSKADLLQCKAKRDQSEKDWKRAQSLRPAKAISDTDYDLAEANYRTAEANVAVGEATIKQNAAALEMAEANLSYTTIPAPVDGVIVDRRVNIGQTVVSSSSAASLFLLAKDSKRMQVWAAVNEADIGRIYVDMPVRFTVDAFPGAVFRGNVLQVRLNATMTQNVVTYTVVVVTDNKDGRLLPYMTANLQFELEPRNDVLQVPNAALRWKPLRATLVAPDASGAVANERKEGSGKRGRKAAAEEANASGEAKSAKPAGNHEERGRVWVKDESGEHVQPIDVEVGVSDGSLTEVSGDGLKEGMEVVVGESVASEDSDTTNPFAPKLFKRGGKR